MNQHFLVELADALDDMPSFARIDAPDVDTVITFAHLHKESMPESR